MITHDPSLFVKRIRHLSYALILSGAINIGVLSVLLYWLMSERPPTPYCEHKPASLEQQQEFLADQRSFSEAIDELSQLSLYQLVQRLSNTKVIENGYTERDLALACMVAFHHFDLSRALFKDDQPIQKRTLVWKSKDKPSPIMLVVYPELTQQQFDSLIQFAQGELWPLTSEGLFLALQKQKIKNEYNHQLIETFLLTSEFWSVELLFNRSNQQVERQEVLTLLLEGSWDILKQFVEQQKEIHDSSNSRRQKFLIDYLKLGSPSAATLLIKTEWDFSVKKLEDEQVISMLKLIPKELSLSIQFAKEMLTSPRSSKVWWEASRWLYAQNGECMPEEWNYQTALARFLPDQKLVELVSKKATVSKPSPLSTSLPIVYPPIGTMNTPLKISSLEKQSAKSTLIKKENQMQHYIVQQKDTLWKIAKKFGVNVEELKVNNAMKSDLLKPGMTLQIPVCKAVTK